MLLCVLFVEVACASIAVGRKSVHDVLICANNVLCARSTPPCDFELYAPEFLVVMLPFLLASAVVSAVRKSS